MCTEANQATSLTVRVGVRGGYRYNGRVCDGEIGKIDKQRRVCTVERTGDRTVMRTRLM